MGNNPSRGGSGVPGKEELLKDPMIQSKLIDSMKAGIDRDIGKSFMKAVSKSDSEIDERLSRIEEKLDDLGKKLDMIFDNHILIDGKFCKVQVTKEGILIEGTYQLIGR